MGFGGSPVEGGSYLPHNPHILPYYSGSTSCGILRHPHCILHTAWSMESWSRALAFRRQLHKVHVMCGSWLNLPRALYWLLRLHVNSCEINNTHIGVIVKNPDRVHLWAELFKWLVPNAPHLRPWTLRDIVQKNGVQPSCRQTILNM